MYFLSHSNIVWIGDTLLSIVFPANLHEDLTLYGTLSHSNEVLEQDYNLVCICLARYAICSSVLIIYSKILGIMMFPITKCFCYQVILWSWLHLGKYAEISGVALREHSTNVNLKGVRGKYVE